MSYQNEKVVLAERPKGIPDPAKTWRYEKGETYTEESLKEGQVLVKNEVGKEENLRIFANGQVLFLRPCYARMD